jgi:hypothetical protein
MVLATPTLHLAGNYGHLHVAELLLGLPSVAPNGQKAQKKERIWDKSVQQSV